jgi:hypothetical protein
MRTARILVLFLLGVVLSAFGRDNTDDRVEYWAAQLPAEVPIGAPVTSLTNYLRARGIEFGGTPTEGAVSFVAEELKGDSLVCKSWLVLVTATVDASGNVAAYKVSRAGICL